MIFIDANLFLAYDNSRDVHHSRAMKLWKEIEANKYGQCFTSDYVFNEVVGVTLRKFGKERARLLGQYILKSIFMLNIDDHILLEAWELFLNTKLDLNLVDCTNLIAVKIADSKFIATFDKEFKKAAGFVVID